MKDSALEWHPFALKFPLLEGDEWRAFKESIRKTKGPEEKIVYRMVNGRKQGIDGRNRHRACEELGIEPPMEKRFFNDEVDVRDFIIRRNVLRRHMPREVRQEIVGDLREQGQSIRQIAQTVGVDPKTVRNDLRDNGTGESGGEFSPPALQNMGKSAKVEGRDGKCYPATKPAPRLPKSGKPIFDDRKVVKTFGALTRLLDQRKDAFGPHIEHDNCLKILNEALASFTRWKKATT